MEFPHQIRAKTKIIKPTTKTALKGINPKAKMTALIEAIRKENPHIKILDIERICNHKGEILPVFITLCEGKSMPSHILYKGCN